MRYLLLCTILFLFSCDNDKVLPGGAGKNGEVLVVIPNNYWEGKTGTAIREILAAEQHGLPQSEPMFSLIRVVPASFNSTFQVVRNILVVNIEPGLTAGAEQKKDIWASGQAVISLEAPDDSTMAMLVTKTGSRIIDAFYQNDLRKTLAGFRKQRDRKRERHLFDKYRFALPVPVAYKIVKEEDDFVWFRSSFDKKEGGELYEVLKNIWIYSEPYLSTDQLSKDSMESRRNRITQLHIEGPLDGSYMQLAPEYPHAYRTYEVNGLQVAELRGLWNMHNARMGGPYVCYSIVDPASNRLFTVDGFVFAPNTDKRDYIRELEAFASAIRFSLPDED